MVHISLPFSHASISFFLISIYLTDISFYQVIELLIMPHFTSTVCGVFCVFSLLLLLMALVIAFLSSFTTLQYFFLTCSYKWGFVSNALISTPAFIKCFTTVISPFSHATINGVLIPLL